MRKRRKMTANRSIKFLCYLLSLVLMLMIGLCGLGLFSETDLDTHIVLAIALIFLVFSIKYLWVMRKIGFSYLIRFVILALWLSQTDNIIVDLFQPFIIFTGLSFALIGYFNLKHMA